MTESTFKDNKPLIGLFPLFYNFGETCRVVLIAKRYKELGGEAIFFSHGGECEYLAEDIGCKVVRIKPIYTKEYIDLLWKSSRLETFKNPFSKKILMEHVNEETKAFKKTGVKLIVSANNFPCGISARVARIPLVSITPKVIISFTKYPDDGEFFFTRLIPQSLKLKILNWYAPKSKGYVRPFSKVAKKFGVSPPKIETDLIKGDYTFFVDSKELIGEEKSPMPTNEYYIGPYFFDEVLAKVFKTKQPEQEEKEILNHLKKPGKSIFFTLGSSGTKELFLKILEVLNKTNYTVIAAYNSILKESEVPKVNDNILIKKFVPSTEKIHRMVDLSITNGGKGTVYTAAYAGKPVIGFPMQFEQHLNLELLVKHGMAIIASRKYFKEKELLKAIDEIFSNYNFYLKNAHILSQKLPKPEGDKNAARKIIEILQQNN